jgi:hypothetical protein
MAAHISCKEPLQLHSTATPHNSTNHHQPTTLPQVSPEKRLGSGPLGAAEIKSHRWFSRIDWAALEQRRIPAPIRPRVRSPLDTSNFDIFDNVDEAPGLPRADKQPSWEQWDWLHE